MNYSSYAGVKLSREVSALLKQGGQDEALRRLEEFNGLSQDPFLLFQAARLHYKQAHKPKALEYLNRALEIDPFDCFCLQLRGDIHYEASEFESAFTDYTNALQREIKRPQVLQGKITAVLLLMGNVEEAKKWTEKRLSLNPDDNYALSQMTQILLIQGDVQGARELVDKRLNTCPTDSVALNQRKLVVIAERNLRQAQEKNSSPTAAPAFEM